MRSFDSSFEAERDGVTTVCAANAYLNPIHFHLEHSQPSRMYRVRRKSSPDFAGVSKINRKKNEKDFLFGYSTNIQLLNKKNFTRIDHL